MIVDPLKAIIVLDRADGVMQNPPVDPPLRVEVPALAGRARLLAQLRSYLGKPLTMRALNEMTAAIYRTYDEIGRPVVDVVVPEQDVTDGIVQIIAIEGHVGAIRVEGSRYFRTEEIRKRIRIRSGDPIDRSILLRDLDSLNRNPFRDTRVLLERGAHSGETDLVFRVVDRFPLRVYGGYENTGSRPTGEDRLLAGFNWGNVLGLEHQLNYQFTSATDVSTYSAHGVSYVMPLLNADTLSLFGTWSSSHPPQTEVNIDSQSQNFQVSGRYSVPLRPVDRLTHSLAFGFDFKHSENNLEFGGTRVFAPVEVVQAVVQYSATLPDPLGKTDAGVSVYLSPGHLTSDNDDEAFDGARSGASASYVYATASLNRITDLPGQTTLVTRTAAQLAGKRLVPSEEFEIGGRGTVRGYPEQAINGDSGLLLNVEMESMPLRPLEVVGIRRLRDDLRFFVFVDAGVTWNRHPDQDYPAQSHLSSVGVGFRYSIVPYLNLEYAYGFRLSDDGFEEDHDSAQHHLSLMAIFTF